MKTLVCKERRIQRNPAHVFPGKGLATDLANIFFGSPLFIARPRRPLAAFPRFRRFRPVSAGFRKSPSARRMARPARATQFRLAKTVEQTSGTPVEHV